MRIKKILGFTLIMAPVWVFFVLIGAYFGASIAICSFLGIFGWFALMWAAIYLLRPEDE